MAVYYAQCPVPYSRTEMYYDLLIIIIIRVQIQYAKDGKTEAEIFWMASNLLSIHRGQWA